MKNVLNRLILVLTTVLLAAAFTACKKDDKNVAVIEVSGDVMTITETTTLFDYMEVLMENGEFEFEAENSEYGKFLTSVNGNKAGLTEFWAIYTSDTENSSAEFGTYNYNEVEYGSANFGISSLIIKDGGVYIFVLTAF